MDKVVILISANAEWRAVKELYPHLEIQQSTLGEFAHLELDPSTSLRASLTLFHGGWGKISAAATTQYVIDRFAPDLLINLGTCGGFAGKIQAGTILLAERTLVYDIIEQMGDADEAIEHYATEIDLSWLGNRGSESVIRGLLISADRDIIAAEIPALIQKYQAVAADWESGAIAWVAQQNHIRVLILRGVTDLVSSEGGEAYGSIEIFHTRTKDVMKKLFEILPDYLRDV